jgi:hypothetical protein
MIRLRAREALLGAVAGVISSGCYGYYPPVTADLSGRRIQTSLTDAGSAALAPRLGRDIGTVEGTLQDDSAGFYVLSILETTRRDGVEAAWTGERVPISHNFVATVKERRFSRSRTALFVVLSAAGAIATKQAFGKGGGSNAPGNTNGNPGNK